MRGLYFSSIEHVAFLYPCKCVHTLFFLRAIDVAFVNKKNKVIEVVDNLSPWKIKFCPSAYYVVEKFSSNNIHFYKVGDFVDIGKEVNYENLSSL